MNVRAEPVKVRWVSLILAIVVMLSGCGREEPAVVDAPPAVKSQTLAIEQASAPVKTPSAAPSAGIDPTVLKQGREVFVHYCADCHDGGDGHPGTMRLAVRLGAEKSVLKAREDLAQDYIKVIVRNGLGMMPAFRPTEVSDTALDALAAYIINPSESSNIDTE